jgi:hypothetical protein
MTFGLYAPYSNKVLKSLLLSLWDAAGLLVNDNYSTPTVNNVYCSSSSCTGIQQERVVE